jgi:hypothetical protein
MGLDVHGLNLVRFAAARQPLGAVATLGRQGLNVAGYQLQALLGVSHDAPVERYCEQVLVDRLGAQVVESFDNSDYEGATHVADLNVEIDPPRRYDTVIDAGTIEHVFDVRQALANVSALARPGGQILHVLPANNQNGHGFFQFSPELFFSLYSADNGYSETRVFLASDLVESHWYEVKPPAHGHRVDVTSSLRTSVLVRTVRGPEVSHRHVQQSDYVELWNRTADPAAAPSRVPPPTGLKAVVDRNVLVSRAVRGTFYKVRPINALRNRLSRFHPDLERLAVADLLD